MYLIALFSTPPYFIEPMRTYEDIMKLKKVYIMTLLYQNLNNSTILSMKCYGYVITLKYLKHYLLLRINLN